MKLMRTVAVLREYAASPPCSSWWSVVHSLTALLLYIMFERTLSLSI